MEERISIKGHNVCYDRETTTQDISSILKTRFTPEDLTEKSLDDLHDPYLLCGMKEAVKRIKQARENRERVIIFWDYDVDGVTSTSILMHLFKTLKMDVSYRLPHRVKDGYGMKKYFIDELAELWVDLIITVDCGTRDVDVVRYSKEKGIDIIVTDHHAVPDVIPEEAVAVINPKRPDCSYPFKWLAGAWVAYKLMMAVAKEYMDDEKYKNYIRESIDIAAIGTVADCMTLTGENRTIVSLGLKQIKNSRSKWIRALIEDKIHEDLDADIFGFLIGPRLNAAGRMDTPYKAVNLILNNSDSLGKTLNEIEMLNDQRKALTTEFVDKALGEIEEGNNIIIYHSPDIRHGIIGIIAGRLTEKFYRPSIVLIDEGDKLVASCRSPEYFSIIDLLEKYKDSFIAFGGHKQAAGFSILKESFEEFKQKIQADLNAEDFSQHTKKIEIDKCVKLDEIGFKFLASMNTYKPFGLWNPKPVFMIENFEPERVSILWKTREHLKFENRYGFKIFAFGFGEHYDELKNIPKMDIIFDLSEDNWMWKRGLMFRIIDIVI